MAKKDLEVTIDVGMDKYIDALKKVRQRLDEMAKAMEVPLHEIMIAMIEANSIMEFSEKWVGSSTNIKKELNEMAKRKATSPFRKGRATARPSSGGSPFLSVKEGDSETFAPLVGLDEMVSADMHEYWDIRPAFYHPCIGRDCPGEAVGNESRFKGYLPVVKKSGEVMIFPFTISVYNQLEELEDELEDNSLKGYVIKFSRRGSGLATRYSVMGLGKRIEVDGIEVPDFISQLGPDSKEEIEALLAKNGFDMGDGTTADETKDDEDETEATVDDEDDDEEWDI